MRLIKSSSFALAILSISSNSFAVPTAYQEAYNYSAGKLSLDKKHHKHPSEFAEKSPEEQANLCIDILKEERPDLASKINLQVFRKGIMEGRYRK